MYGLKGASTVKALQVANERGIEIYHIDRENAASIVPKLEVSNYVKQSIIDFANAGKEITIPKTNIEYHGTTIAGYIVMDPDSGAAGYLISGGTGGGKTSFLQLIAKKLKDTALSGAVSIVEHSLKTYMPFREDGFYEATAAGVVRGYVSGFTGTVKEEWNGIKDLPKLIKEALNFGWDYSTNKEFRQKVKYDLENLVKTFPDIWSKKSEIMSAIYNYYIDEVEDVSSEVLGISSGDEYFTEFAVAYSTGKVLGFATVIAAEIIIGAKLATVIKDFVKASKLKVLFEMLQVAKGKAIEYVVDIYRRATVSVKNVFFEVLDILEDVYNDSQLNRIVPKYFSQYMDVMKNTVEKHGDEAAEIIALGLKGWQEIANKVDNIMAPYVSKINQLYPDAKVGYRGSLATGVKYEPCGPFNPSDFDVDAFIVSDELAAKFPSGEWFRDAKNIDELESMPVELEDIFKNTFEGYRIESWG